MKNFKKIIILLLSVLIPFGVLVQTASASKLPTVRTTEKRLADEIQKMIDAGHLRPAYYNANEHPQRITGKIFNNAYIHYWANPAETIYTLLIALPHVPSTMKPQLRTYIQNEWQNYNPSVYSHSGWGGAARELFAMPAETTLSQYAYNGGTGKGTHDAWEGWSFNPFNFYAAWLYAKEFGSASSILNSMRSKIVPLPTGLELARMPHILNIYIAGYYGYLNLQTLAGETQSSQVKTWLNDALSRRKNALTSAPPSTFNGSESGGFLYVIPELGDYLYNNARNEAANYINQSEKQIPYWFVSRMDETTRIYGIPIGSWDGSGQRHEGSTAHYYDYSSLFKAKALVLKQGRAELEKYLDVPAVYRGDLFYIQNLVRTIEAGPAPTPDPSTNPSASPFTKGDVNHDGIVNIQDMLKVLTNLGKSVSSVSGYFDPKGDININILDAAYIIRDW